MRRAARTDAPREKACAQCGAVFPCRPSHYEKVTYCSRACLSAAYKQRMDGAGNPNYKAAGVRTCEKCGEQYQSYNKQRRYCSSACYNLTRPAAPRQLKLVLVKPPPEPKRPRERKPLNRFKCQGCGIAFLAAHKVRAFCGYPCFVNSGGPFRAGIAAAAMTRKYGAKKDANHREVVDAIRASGCAFFDLSAAGMGIPDGIAWVKDAWRLVEIKNPETGYGRRGLNPVQSKWIRQWRGGPVYILKSAEDARAFCEGRFDAVHVVLSAEDAVRIVTGSDRG